MILNIENKKSIVIKLNKLINKSLSIVTANFCGITSQDMNKLRKLGRDKKVSMYIARNTLIKKALEDTNFKNLIDYINYPTIIAFSENHPGLAVRIFRDFSKENKKFKIKNAIFKNNVLFSINDINELADMPTYEESIIKFILLLKEISLFKFLNTLKALCIK